MTHANLELNCIDFHLWTEIPANEMPNQCKRPIHARVRVKQKWEDKKKHRNQKKIKTTKKKTNEEPNGIEANDKIWYILTCEQEKYFRKKATTDYSCMHMNSSTSFDSSGGNGSRQQQHTAPSDWNFFKLDPNFTVWLLQQRNVHFHRRRSLTIKPAWAVTVF